ncbi:type III PLP-dependent enzyme [Streptomyces sp. Wh19]|uniref:type III PLP-dependent enzyme n=1 Tax=Streptomyces sp. Wh19 TaxID=3076629 RepID=UPI0029587383|nr:type III PLP-dependent enzyme [Streptomyces sp. Wh19]MDV9194463.1 type III PLP-dependent enzyme [Streptomyces sp. Wh19]
MKHLAERYGTPLYVYRLDDVRASVQALRRVLPEGVRLYYSVKANPHPTLVRELVGHGLGSEVSSTGELDVCLTGGQDPRHCLYTGPGKTPAEIHHALARGVRTFSVESPADYHRLAQAVLETDTEVDFLVRLNTGQAVAGHTGLRMSGAPTQFGMPPDDARTLLRPSESTQRLRPVGVHVFPATNVFDTDALLGEWELSLSVVAQLLRESGSRARLVDLGGGFAAPFAQPGVRPEYADLRKALTSLLDAYLPRWRQGEPEIMFESGRHLVADCGTLLTRVLDVKQNGGATYVVLDAGTNNLGGMSGLGRLLTPSVQPLPDSAVEESVVQRVGLVGPLCTPLDVLNRSLAIHVPEIGGVLAIPNVGAYGLTASLVSFLSRPLPVEIVMEEDGSVVDARQLSLRERKMEAE